MGTLHYGAGGAPFEVADRILPFLRIVVMNKLRRAEPFMLTLKAPDGSGGRFSIWVAPAVPLVFGASGRVPSAGEDAREIIDQMMQAASGPDGLDVTTFA